MEDNVHHILSAKGKAGNYIRLDTYNHVVVKGLSKYFSNGTDMLNDLSIQQITVGTANLRGKSSLRLGY